MKDKFFITTPIYYVNDRPHIGHAYTTVVADTFARFYRAKLGAENVFFLTGTDEHGTKVAESAAKKGLEPQAFADEVSAEYKNVWATLGVSYDEFFRTTDPRHEAIVGEFLTNLYDRGFIYKGTYKGWYCVGCEKYLSFEEIKDGACIQHPKTPLIEQEEENYFFKLGDFSKKVLAEIEKDDEGAAADFKVGPAERRNEILGKIRQGVNDVSVSRPGVSWGIPLPWDKNHTVYVWVDALINYYSATKIFTDKNGSGDGKSRERFWPADLHIVGKDILWFHSLVWPGLLLASDLALPRSVFAHGFFTVDGQKMSKSLGNVIDPLALVAEYGVDATRYLLISAFTFGSDGDISLEKFKEKFNADLANGLGNLVARVAKLAEKLDKNPVEINSAANFLPEVEKAFEENRPDKALDSIFSRVKTLDQKIAEQTPWTKEGEELTALLKSYMEELLIIGANLSPFLPATSAKILEIFTAEKITKPEALFLRK
ncbi:MAG: methionine--tRNA ligase [Patescibacteria group bacterium]